MKVYVCDYTEHTRELCSTSRDARRRVKELRATGHRAMALFPRVDLGRLYAALGYRGSKIPLKCSGTFTEVPVYDRSLDMEPWARLTVVIQPGPRRRRVFVVCPECGKQLPFGSISQHIGSGRCE